MEALNKKLITEKNELQDEVSERDDLIDRLMELLKLMAPKRAGIFKDDFELYPKKPDETQELSEIQDNPRSRSFSPKTRSTNKL